MDWITHFAAQVWGWLGTVNWANASIVFATLGGPVLAVQAQKWLERRRSVDERRHAIFRTLMATRAAMLSGEHVQAFNAVPVEFYGSKGKLKEINTAWKTYLDHHAEDNPPDDEWVKKRLNLFYDLLFLISQFLGFNFTREQLQRDFYGPRAHGDLETEQTIIRRGLVRLFAGETTLPMAVKEFPADEQVLLNQAALQKLLQEWLEGERAVKVQNEGQT